MNNALHWLTVIADDVEHSAQLVELGCSPAEQDHNPEANREVSFIDHEGCPEMAIEDWECVA